MRIKFGRQFINTDHIAHVQFHPQGDGSTNHITPCLMITFAGEKVPVIIDVHDGDVPSLWELIASEATITIGKEVE